MTTHKSDCAAHNAPAMEPGKCDCNAMPEKLYIWLADNGNMRKFSKEPFEGGSQYIREDVAKKMINSRQTLGSWKKSKKLGALTEVYEAYPIISTEQAREQALREAAEIARATSEDNKYLKLYDKADTASFISHTRSK